MDDVPAQRLGIAAPKSLCTGSFPAAALAGDATPEDVVLAPSVDSDHPPHVMIVRQQRHVGRPHDVENGEVTRTIERLQHAAGRLAQPPEKPPAAGWRSDRP